MATPVKQKDKKKVGVFLSDRDQKAAKITATKAGLSMQAWIEGLVLTALGRKAA